MTPVRTITPRGMVLALIAAKKMVELTGMDVLAAKLEGNRRAERKAHGEQVYWQVVSAAWRKDLRAMARRSS